MNRLGMIQWGKTMDQVQVRGEEHLNTEIRMNILDNRLDIDYDNENNFNVSVYMSYAINPVRFINFNLIWR